MPPRRPSVEAEMNGRDAVEDVPKGEVNFAASTDDEDYSPVKPARGRGQPHEDGASDSATAAARAISPELGVPHPAVHSKPAAPPLVARSSSLSALSERSSSPPTALAKPPSSLSRPLSAAFNSPQPHYTSVDPSTPRLNGIVKAENGDGEPMPLSPASPASTATATASKPSKARGGETDDSLSQLDDEDGHSAEEGEMDEDEDRASVTSTAPSVASSSRPLAAVPVAHPVPPARRPRGRPRGSKTGQKRGAPIVREQRGTPSAYKSPGPGGSGSAGGSTTPTTRATRANVTLPPGYIEGVTSSRWPKGGPRPREGEEGEAPSSRSSSVGTTTTMGMGEEEKNVSGNGVDRKGKGKAIDQDASVELGLGLDQMDSASMAMSRETSAEEIQAPPVRAGVAIGSTGRGRGRGKRGKKVVPEPVERAKRRKLDIPDELAASRAAEREGARLKLLEQLEEEGKLVDAETHPLLAFTYNRLQEEKAQNLRQLRRYQEEREMEFARMADAQMRAIWRQWADKKDALRMELYHENHNSLKDLIAEEKSFPRDHPLFMNHYGLPPTPYYRGPVRDPTFVPRSVIHAGHYVEPPPFNPAVEHDSWRLSPSEVEADLALFFDIDDDPYPQAAIPPLPPVPPLGMYPYASYYYDPNAPVPVPPPGYITPPVHPPPHSTAYPPPQAYFPHQPPGYLPPHDPLAHPPYVGPVPPYPPPVISPGLNGPPPPPPHQHPAPPRQSPQLVKNAVPLHPQPSPRTVKPPPSPPKVAAPAPAHVPSSVSATKMPSQGSPVTASTQPIGLSVAPPFPPMPTKAFIPDPTSRPSVPPYGSRLPQGYANSPSSNPVGNPGKSLSSKQVASNSFPAFGLSAPRPPEGYQSRSPPGPPAATRQPSQPPAQSGAVDWRAPPPASGNGVPTLIGAQDQRQQQQQQQNSPPRLPSMLSVTTLSGAPAGRPSPVLPLPSWLQPTAAASAKLKGEGAGAAGPVEAVQTRPKSGHAPSTPYWA
ncbi:hypothetical protein JCM21900_006051 [Sporobolomyces salmonicolor]